MLKFIGRLYTAEKLIIIALLFNTLAYLLTDTPSPDSLGYYWRQLRVAALAYAFALLLCFIGVMTVTALAARREGRPASEAETWCRFRELFFNLGSLVKDWRCINVIVLTLQIFNELKNLIPTVNPLLFDEPLLRFEYWLLGDRLAAQWLHGWFGLSATELMSQFYSWYYPYLTLVCLFLVMQRRERLRTEFCLAFSLLWFLGIVTIYALPTWGPCFYVPELFHSLPETGITQLQGQLWQLKLAKELYPQNPDFVFLISGLPSLHLAMTILGSWYLQRWNWVLGLLSWIFCALTILSTLFLGWHYLLDDLASLPLAAAAIWLAGREVASS